MECPYCRGELEPGGLRTNRGPIHWVPKGMKMGLLFPSEGELEENGGFRLDTGSDIQAWYCRTCNRLTIFDANAR